MSKLNPDRSGRIASPRAARRAASGLSIVLAWALAAVLLVSSGLVYRTLAGRLEGMDPIALPVPLERFPLQMDGWTGQDTPLLEATQEYMRTHFADDYISRYYVNAETGQSAGLYVVYCSSQPGGILGHQPQVCYPGTGWTWDRTDPAQFTSQSGREIPCNVHRFHKKEDPGYREIIVLNFYVVNGRIRTHESDFSGFWYRRPNIEGDSARYVAQIQVAATLESSAMALARDMTDMILSYLPDTGRNADRVQGAK